MLFATYLQLKRFNRYVSDWIATGLIFGYFFLVAEHALPFNRQFKLNDPTIQHPFTVHERVTGHMCLALAAIVPSVVIAAVTFVKYKHNRNNCWHLLQVSLLGLAFTVSVDGVITDILKCWVGRARPDFLQRCGPEEGTPVDVFVDVSVCTAPLGTSLLADGMRSTPSGHSSILFSAFLFLSLWIWGQFQLSKPGRPLHVYLFAVSPLLLAAYVALSRVQDYRHHFVDIFLGGILGCTVAILVYGKYFHPIASEKSHELRDEDDELTLPL